jgi:hypothetical protein
MKQLLLDLRDAVKYWCRESGEAERHLEDVRMETARLIDGATRENQRLQAQLEVEMATGTYPTGSAHPYPHPQNFTRRVTRTRMWVKKIVR